jgi:hypothetical protein
MDDRKYSDAAFAKAVTAAVLTLSMTKRRPVSVSAVTKWRLGKTIPRREATLAIENLTGGEVTAGSFVHAERP